MKKKIMYSIIIVSIIIAIFTSIYMIINNDKKENDNKSSEYALKFKKEYEDLNGKKAYGDYKYKELNISEDNPIMYSNYKEIINIISSKTGVIYFGFPDCPWCRNAVEVLLDSAKFNGVEEIYYLNIKDIRDSYKVIDGVLTKTTEAGEGYYELLETLDSILEDYVVDGVNTGVKRLYAPTVVFVKNGEIVGSHVSTVELEDGQTAFDNLTKDQKQELEDIYNYYMEQTFNDYCTDAC